MVDGRREDLADIDSALEINSNVEAILDEVVKNNV